jgi:uncharacterized metal-binding protein
MRKYLKKLKCKVKAFAPGSMLGAFLMGKILSIFFVLSILILLLMLKNAPYLEVFDVNTKDIEITYTWDANTRTATVYSKDINEIILIK